MKTLPSIPDPVLRSESVRIDPREITDALVASMFRTMRECGGTGLAAPQLGMLYRLAVIECDLQRLVLVNPTLAPLGKPKDRVYEDEGCLSLPGRRFSVPRFPAVKVNWTAGEDRLSLTVTGRLARIVQHEVDHLRGVLVDRVGQEVKDVAA